MDEPYENTNQRHDRGKKEQQDGDTNIQKTENKPLANMTSETQDETTKEQASSVRRPDKQDKTSEERALGVRRPDNQDETSKELALGVRRPDNQDEASEEQALAIRRPDNQKQTEIVPLTPMPLALQQLAFVQQIAGSGNITLINPTGCIINMHQSKDHAQISHPSGQPPVGRLESAQRESHRAALPEGGKQTSECSPLEKHANAQRAGNLCEAALKSVYKTTGSFVQMIPWVDDDKMHIMDIYTKLVMEAGGVKLYWPKQLNRNDNKLKSYEEIFELKTREGEIVKLCVFNGLPGRGKSTLFDKMAYDWAIGSVPAMQGYKLVVLLKMNALEQSSDLVDAMFDQLLAEDVMFEKGDLQSYIKSNPEKVLILLDGFDELITTDLSESSFGSILKILNRKMLRGCCTLVSTRPSHYDNLVSKPLVQNPFSHIRVLGFGAKEVHEYVHKFYYKDDGEAKKLLAKIQSPNIPSDLAESPMLLLLMCLLWRADSKLPDTLSRLYSEAVNYIFRRKGDVLSEDDIARCVHEIGRVGLKGLLSPNQTLSFKEKDFERDNFTLAIKVGILTSQRVLKKVDTHNNVQFIHKTFQEYCSGKYLEHLRKKDPGEFQKNLEQIMTLHPKNFEFVLRFCCGDSKECTRAVLQLLWARFPDEWSYSKTVIGRLAANCYVEAQSEQLANEELLHFLIPSRLQIGRSEVFLKCVAKHVNDSGSINCLAKVEEVTIHVQYVNRKLCDLKHLRTDLKGCMSAMTNLKQFCLVRYPIEEEEEESIAESLSTLHKLDHLRFYECSGGSKRFWSNLFKAFKNLHTLTLECCRFTPQEMQCVAESLVDVPNFAELNICDSRRSLELHLWYMALKQLSHLQKLSIVSCPLTKRDMELVAEAFSGLPNLEELDISKNNLGDSAALWAFQLKCLKRLQKINLSLCGLIGQDMKLIAEAFGSLPYVEELNLSLNDLQSSAELWSAHLQALKHLKKLGLSLCMLTEPDVEHIAEALGDLPDLVEVDLSHNRFLGGSGKPWSIHLKQVENLDLMACFGEEEENMKHFAETLGHLVKLVELNLSRNDALGGSAQVWCEHFKHFKNLQKLGLSECALNGGDVDHVFGSLCSLCNLIELDLSGNPCNDSGATWPEQLQLLVSLQKLYLADCSLEEDAMNRILGSLSRLPNLIEMDFHQNNFLHDTAALWSNHLQKFNELQKLNLRDCRLTKDEEKVLRDSLMDQRTRGLVIEF